MLVTVLAVVLVVQVGVTPFWASDAARAAMALESRTIVEALDAAQSFSGAVTIPQAPAADTVIAEATLTPDTPVTVFADEVSAQATFLGFEVDEAPRVFCRSYAGCCPPKWGLFDLITGGYRGTW